MATHRAIFCYIILLIVMCQNVQSVRILGIFPHIGKSHFLTFKPLLMNLAAKGHQVTVVSHFPLEQQVKNYRDISMAGTVPLWHGSFTFGDFDALGKISSHLLTAYLFRDAALSTCKALLENKEAQQLKEGQFDVVLIEQFQSDCGMGIVHKLKAPFIGVTSHILMPFTRNRVGITVNEAFVSNHFLGHGSSPDIWQTIESLLVNTFYKSIFKHLIQSSEQKMVWQKLGENVPYLEDVAKTMDLLMISTYFPLNGAQLLPPNVVEIGGFHLINDGKGIEKDLQKFLDDSTQGVIIFSMGSMLRATSWPQDKLEAFQKAFSAIPQKILWKWENDTMDGIPANVKILQWLPQFSALRHPNVKGFIGHGGLGGMMEAIQVGVPVMVIPMFGDQFANAQSAKESGFAIVMNYANISTESITWGVKELLSPKMQKKAKQVSAQWNDRLQSPMDTAIYWIEHVARHGGHLMRSPAVDVPWIRYYLLDVYAVLVSIVLFVSFVTWKLLSLCLGLVCGKKSPRRDLKAKKTKKNN